MSPSRRLTVLTMPDAMAVRYGFAVLCVAVALGLALLLQSVDITVTPFLIAIAISVWTAGTGPGVLAIVLSLASLDYFFTPPVHSFAFGLAGAPELLAFVVLALVVTGLSASRRRAEQALRRGRAELESIVAERTAALRRSEAYLAEAQRLTHTGSFVRRVPTGEAAHSSNEHARLWGFDRAEGIPSLPAFLERVHPDDLDRFQETWTHAIRNKVGYDLTFRVRLPDGSLHDLNSVASPVLGPTGELVEYIGTTVDVTERLQAERERQAHLWFFESMDRVNRAMQGTSDLEQMMSDVVAAVREIFESDRAWVVYPCDPDAASWRVAMEHTRPEYPGGYAVRYQAAMDADIANLFRLARMATGPVRLGAGSPHPLPPLLTSISVQSQLCMAIYPKLDRPYLFGVHQCSYARHWTIQEERLFEQIGRRLADALTTVLMFRNVRESEAKLEQAQSIAHVGHWQRDLVTGRITWSNETYRMMGLSPKETVLDYELVQRLVHPDDRETLQRAVDATLATGVRLDTALRWVRPDGEVRIVHSRGEVASDEQGRPVQLFGTAQDITERKQAEQALEALAGRLIHAQEEERSRIGRELHDHISQSLGLLLIRIDQVKASPDLTPAVGRALAELRESTSEVTADVHRLSHRLHSTMLDYLGLVPALERLVAEFSAHHGIAIGLAHARVPARLPSDVALSVFRVIEESLTNVAKHSHARSARVTVNGTQDGLHATVEDDGEGFDPAMLAGRAGLGFVSMQERLRVVRGTVRVESAPSRGTTIDVRVPAASLVVRAAAGGDTAAHGAG